LNEVAGDCSRSAFPRAPICWRGLTGKGGGVA